MKIKKNVFIHPKFKLNNEISYIKIYQHMKKNCVNLSKYFSLNNSNDNIKFNVDLRNSLVKNLFILSKKLKFKSLTIFKSINYFDLILNSYSPKDERDYMRIALICFIISSKFWEKDPLIPNIIFFIRNFSEIIDNKYFFSCNEIRLFEIECLKILNYNLNICNKYDFLCFYFTQGIVYYENNKNIIDKIEKIYLIIRNLIEEISISNIEIEYYSKSNLVIKYIIKCLIEKYFNKEQTNYFLNKYKNEELLDNKIKKKLDLLLNNKKNYERKNISEFVFLKKNNEIKLKRIFSDKNLFKESCKNEEKKKVKTKQTNNIKYNNLLKKKSSSKNKYSIKIEQNYIIKLIKNKKQNNFSQSKISKSHKNINFHLSSPENKNKSEKIISSNFSKFYSNNIKNKTENKYNSTIENKTTLVNHNFSKSDVKVLNNNENIINFYKGNIQTTKLFSPQQKTNFHCDLLMKTINLLNNYSPFSNDNEEYKIQNLNRVPSNKSILDSKNSINYNSIYSDSKSYLNFNYNYHK